MPASSHAKHVKLFNVNAQVNGDIRSTLAQYPVLAVTKSAPVDTSEPHIADQIKFVLHLISA